MNIVNMAEALRQTFYNRETGFGSARETFKQAKRLDPTVTLKATREYLKRQEVNQVKTKPTYNSFVGHGPREEFQVDIADFGKYASPRYGLAAVDPFTKRFDIEPIRNKDAVSTAKALDEIIRDMNLPNSLYHDEGGEFKGAFAKRAKYYDITQHVTRTLPRFVDRAIRTFKEAAAKRMRALGEDDWIDVSTDVVNKMNSTVHSSTGLAPNNVEGKNETAAKLSMELKARKRRVDPPIAEADEARRALKMDTISKDGPNWSSKLHRVESITETEVGKKYKIAGFKEPFFRHELQKVTAVERAPGVAPLAERPTLKQVRLRERLAAQRDSVYSMLKASGGMSLLQLRANTALMSDLRKQGIKNWSEFLRLYPAWFKVSRGRVAVAPTAAAAAAEVASKAPGSMQAPRRGIRVDDQGRVLLI